MFWGSSLCTFALKQMDFNWRGQTLRITENKKQTEHQTTDNPTCHCHRHLFSLSHTHTHADFSARDGGVIRCVSVRTLEFFSYKEWLCQRLNHCHGETYLFFCMFYIFLIAGAFTGLCLIVLQCMPGFNGRTMWCCHSSFYYLVNLFSSHYHERIFQRALNIKIFLFVWASFKWVRSEAFALQSGWG